MQTSTACIAISITDGITAVQVGSHVLVPFGSGNRQREGFVLRVLDSKETNESVDETAQSITLKHVLRVIEPYPILTPEQIDLAFWMQKNYLLPARGRAAAHDSRPDARRKNQGED